jgi:NAD(P)-dependent dehydrogenase (short-subunit alcohol dehydrogenase family)
VARAASPRHRRGGSRATVSTSPSTTVATARGRRTPSGASGAHGRTALLKADLGDAAQVAAMLDALATQARDVRVFVANAAATAFKPL